MRRMAFTVGSLVGLLWSGGCTSVTTNPAVEVVSYVEISMPKAIETALRNVPGSALEAKLTEENQRIVYRIYILDRNHKIQTVYVDAESGLLVDMNTTAAPDSSEQIALPSP